jgi:hypothetical protein
MPNHLHLLIETPQPNLGRGMQRLHGDYGRWFSDRRGKAGHVFQGRYGAVRVQDDRQLWAVAAYIARNPVEAGLCEVPEAWRWSSHRATAGGDLGPGWLDHHRLLDLLGGGAGGDPQERYAAYVADRTQPAAPPSRPPRSPRAARRRPRVPA